MSRKLCVVGMSGATFLLAAGPCHAASAAAGDTGYLLNTLFMLLCGILVMFMAAGFTMLEAGMVRSKSVATICAKNISLYAIAGIAFYLVGYELMYGESETGLIGTFGIWSGDDQAALSGADTSGQASAADWFFQMVFVATAASVVSGALAERIRFWPFAISTTVLAALIYPVVGAWTWGGGWLSELGFADFAGSTIVHSVGGWVALVGVVLIGARRERFDNDGRPVAIPPSSLPYATLGVFILWLGWFGFNGGSQLSFSSVADAIAVADIFVNTNAAAAAGVVTVAVLSQLLLRRLDLPMILNGALAGLVSITAEPATPNVAEAMLIGAVGAAVMMAACWILERCRLDDVVGAVPVHLAAGIWGTLAVPLTNPDASFMAQAIGVASVGAAVCIASGAAWMILASTIGLRLRSEHEQIGSDKSEIGLSAHNFS